MTLFFDRCVGKQVPELLEGCGLAVASHDMHFATTTTDEELLEAVGKQRWAFITVDERIARRRSQRQAIADHRVRCFLLCGAAGRTAWHKIRIIARHWDLIEAETAKEDGAFLFRLHLNGRRWPDQLPRPNL